MIKTIADLDVYMLSYRLAMEIFEITRSFPKEEKYSLTDQIIRSSRSITANIAEGWGKRSYENEFKRHLIYAMGSMEETKVWLNFAKDCNYIEQPFLIKSLMLLVKREPKYISSMTIGKRIDLTSYFLHHTSSQ
jgi:four helix bundle protein